MSYASDEAGCDLRLPAEFELLRWLEYQGSARPFSFPARTQLPPREKRKTVAGAVGRKPARAIERQGSSQRVQRHEPFRHGLQRCCSLQFAHRIKRKARYGTKLKSSTPIL